MAYEEDIARWLQEAAELEAKEEETLPDGRKTKEVAEQKIEQCLRYDATNADALAAWVGLYVRSGRGPLVMKRLNRIIRDNPESVGPYRAVAAFMRITGKLTLAVQYFQNLLAEVPEPVKPIVHLSLAIHQQHHTTIRLWLKLLLKLDIHVTSIGLQKQMLEWMSASH